MVLSIQGLNLHLHILLLYVAKIPCNSNCKKCVGSFMNTKPLLIITGNAQIDESFVAKVVVKVFSVAEGFLQVFVGVDFGQKLFRHFRKVSDDVGVTGQNDVPAGNDAEQDRHLDSETL